MERQRPRARQSRIRWHIVSSLLLSLATSLIISLTGRAEAAVATGPISESNDRETANGKVLRINLHPVSSYIRRLERQLQIVEEELQRLHADHEESDNRYLRQLQESHEMSHSNDVQSRQEEKQALRRRLHNALSTLEGSSAAYASLMQFPHPTAPVSASADEDHNRHLREYNSNIDEYNERYRRYSRHEWAIRRDEEHDLSRREDERTLQQEGAYFIFTRHDNNRVVELNNLPLFLHSDWQAAEIALNMTSVELLVPQYRITLSFDSGGYVTGESGCNFYRAPVMFYSDDIIEVGHLGTTLMQCDEGRMDQELQYISFIQGKKFRYEIRKNGTEFLFHLLEEGDVVARFVSFPNYIDRDENLTTVAPTSTPSETNVSNEDEFSIAGTNWEAIEIGYNTNASVCLQPTLQGYPITLSFKSEGRFDGHAGCNRYGGDLINVTDSKFTVGSLFNTEMYCIEDHVMEQEETYLRLLSDRTFYYAVSVGNETELLLKNDLKSGDGGEVEGEVIARFVLLPALMASRKLLLSSVDSTLQSRFDSALTNMNPATTDDSHSTASELDSLSPSTINLDFFRAPSDAKLIPVQSKNSSGQLKDVERNPLKSTVIKTNFASAHNISIIGTEWKATQIAFFVGGTNSSSTIEMHPVLTNHTITLGFASDKIYGNTGCNNYFSFESTISTDKLYVGHLATTRMLCSDEGVMKQEDAYKSMMSERTFFYKLRLNGAKDDKLVLTEVVSQGGYEVEGRVLARFLRSSVRLTQSVRKEVGVHVETTEVKTKKKGGLFNAYQTTPVHQGYGTHFATIWVGTPPQRKSVIIDTGSHYTAFPCKGCNGCGEEHHTDKFFDPDESSTFHALTCSECQSATCLKGKCVFSQSYTEGSSWHAFEAVDKVFLGGRDPSDALSPINNSFKTDFLFGCAVAETGLFVTQLADGIMGAYLLGYLSLCGVRTLTLFYLLSSLSHLQGMSAHPSTLPKVMYDQEKLEHNMFSICFRRELHVSKRGILAGMLTLGGIDTRADLTPMVYARNVASTGWFTVFVKNIYVREQGGQSVTPDGPHQKLQRVNANLFEMNSGKGVIVDSGTTDTYLHRSVAGPFNEVWEKVTGRKYSNSPVALSQNDLLLLPTVLIQLAAYDDVPNPVRNDLEIIPGLAGDIDPSSPQDIILAIPATHYMEYSPSKRSFTPRLYFTESKGGVIGSNAMQRHNVLFDWENRRVGFAESTCEYEAVDEQSTDDANVEVDCRLGNPSLQVSCSETVDLSQCDRHGNSDLTLTGHEIWTRIVDAPGTMQGTSCEQVSISENEKNGGGKMEVQCDGKGICQEVRECGITCANAHAAGDYGGVSPMSGTSTVNCGGATWSACDYSCTQTRINTILMTDGKCYVERALEFTRPCHIQACGRSDPCRVPFVVHAILKIRGAVASRWNKRAEEVFSDAFASIVNENRQENANVLFGPGDVQVLRASPWRASDDAIFGEAELEVDEELGMQLVVETSIFNYNAVVPSAAVHLTQSTSKAVQANTNNISFFGRSKFVPMSSCNEADLHHLANTARDINTALAQPNFVARIMERIRLDEASEQMVQSQSSPFFHTIEDATLAQQSSVVTSWTIKTDIGAGSSRGLDFIGSYSAGGSSVILLLLSTSVVIGYLVWSRRPGNRHRSSTKNSNIRTGTSISTNHRINRNKYSGIESSRSNNKNAIKFPDDDADSIISLLDDSSDYRSASTSVATARGDVELTFQSDSVSVLSDSQSKD
eukprot:CCRYP_006541-RA/>CCRYP_006541-RA protein AED:0.04 eAED:0.04 QI:235/1/1/1/0.83/0.71/7/828/1739